MVVQSICKRVIIINLGLDTSRPWCNGVAVLLFRQYPIPDNFSLMVWPEKLDSIW